jgi:deoxyribonuclease V
MNSIPHPWNVTQEEAIAIQRLLADQVDTQTPIDLGRLRLVAGVDVSVKNEISRAAIVVLTFPDLLIVEAVTAEMPTPFPYITGLLSFREGAVILAAHQRLQRRPDAYIFDGMGIAHPRRLGIAAHIGLWLDAPTVGCGKTHLVGYYGEVGIEKGSYAPLKYRGEVVGAVLRTRANTKPVFASPGHRATVDTARELILRCATRYRLPEPVRAAHNMAGQAGE